MILLGTENFNLGRMMVLTGLVKRTLGSLAVRFGSVAPTLGPGAVILPSATLGSMVLSSICGWFILGRCGVGIAIGSLARVGSVGFVAVT